jgi:hypothetical protein
MADIAAESNGYTRPCQETRNNVTSEFGEAPDGSLSGLGWRS